MPRPLSRTLAARVALCALAALSVFLALPTLAFADAAPVPAGLPWWVIWWPIISGVASVGYTFADNYPRTHAFLSILAKAGLDLPAILDALHRLLTGLTPAQKAAMKAAAKAAAKAVCVALVLVGSQTACISVTPTVPVTPANTTQISTCETVATEHNFFVMGGIGVGAGGTAMAAVAAAVPDNKGLQQGLAVGAAIAGGLTAAATGGAGLTASSFASNRCTDVVAPLPMKPAATEPWPWSPPRVVESVDVASKVITVAGGAP